MHPILQAMAAMWGFWSTAILAWIVWTAWIHGGEVTVMTNLWGEASLEAFVLCPVTCALTFMYTKHVWMKSLRGEI